MAQTSIAAYFRTPEGYRDILRRRIRDYIDTFGAGHDNPGVSREQISKDLGIPINVVTPRVLELIKSKEVIVAGVVKARSGLDVQSLKPGPLPLRQ